MFKRSGGGLDVLLQRKEPSILSKFCSDPILFLAQVIYRSHPAVTCDPPSPVTVVCISDTHNCQLPLPEGDILVHAGDLTQSGSLKEIQQAIDWLKSQPHRHKIVIAGNHDTILDPEYPSGHACDRDKIEWGGVIYLQSNSVTVQSTAERYVKIFGSPFTPRHGNWAFQHPRSQDVWKDLIPDDVDILITHGPPKGHLDVNGLGCEFLLKRLWKMSKKPKLHVFGHIHAGYGIERVYFDRIQRAYDDVMLSYDRVFSLVCLILLYLASLLGFEERQPSTWLVNGSAVGGLRDENRRAAITVTI